MIFTYCPMTAAALVDACVMECDFRDHMAEREPALPRHRGRAPGCVAKVFEHSDCVNFQSLIESARSVCFNSCERVDDRVVEVTELVNIGRGGLRPSLSGSALQNGSFERRTFNFKFGSD